MAKSFLIICIISIALVFALQTDSFNIRTNDLIVGALRPGNVLVHNQTIIVSGYNNNGSQIAERNITYNGNGTITRVRALDRNYFGTGGYASITSGGPGYSNVTINLIASGQNRSLYFYVDIYAV